MTEAVRHAIPFGMKRIPWILRLLVLGVIFWAAGLVIFVNLIPRNVPVDTSGAGAIVVLTGGSGRVEEGLKLFEEARAPLMLISGIGEGVRPEEVLGHYAQDSRITLGYRAHDTVGNAREAAQWLHQHRIRKFLLVTAAYHMPRSLLEFKQELPDVTAIPWPVLSERVRLDAWWYSPGTALLLIGEYHKTIGSQLREWLIQWRHTPASYGVTDS